ncbi:MAG: glycosyltransferase, partial [Candidatus Poribacteria bacterium]|nr:glycosyltransferase [Candidatus Poribacteria bacterium]
MNRDNTEYSPLITIIMPVYNGERYLRQSIESLLNQTYGNFQLIIVDDGSTDRTPEIIQSFDDARIEYHRRAVNKGYPYLDDMLPFVKGAYITASTDDDLFVPERLEMLVNCVREAPALDAVFERAALIDQDGNPVSDWAMEFAVQNPATTPEEVLPFMFAGHALSGLFIRKDFLDQLGGAFEQRGFEAAGDFALNFEILKHGKVKIVDKTLTKFRIHKDNYSRTRSNEISETAARIISKNRRALSIEQIFPQILQAESEREGNRIKAQRHFQLAMYMNRYGTFHFVSELIEMDLERAIAADPQLADAWHALGVIRWRAATDDITASYEALKAACKLSGGNPEFRKNFQEVAHRTGRDGKIEGGALNLEATLEKYHRIRTQWEYETEKVIAKRGDAETIEPKGRKEQQTSHHVPRPPKFKVLVVSSFYPTHHVDAADLICQKLCESLKAEGYAVRVMTSDFVAPSYQKFGLYPIPYPGIYRDLRLEFDDDSPAIQEASPEVSIHNASVVQGILQDFSPDVIVGWNMTRFSDAFWADITAHGIPTVEKAQIVSAVDVQSDGVEALGVLLERAIQNFTPDKAEDRRGLVPPGSKPHPTVASSISLTTSEPDKGKMREEKESTHRVDLPKAEEDKPAADRVGGGLQPELLPVVWSAPVFDPSGYADEARNYVLALDKHSDIPLQLNPIQWSHIETELDAETRAALVRLSEVRFDYPAIEIQHIFPTHFRPNVAALYNIGRTIFETDRLPDDWVARCNTMDEIWVPTDFNLETFARAGVKPRLFKVPATLPVEQYNPDIEPLAVNGRRGFNFLSIFDYSRRKGWDILLRAYLTEFHADEDVALIIKTYSSMGLTAGDLRMALQGFIQNELQISMNEMPEIIMLDAILPATAMPRLFGAADAYVMPSRAEGWGRPYMEAMAMGLATIGTRWSGNMEFMTDETTYLIDCDVVDVPEVAWREIPTYRGHRWVEPKVDHLRQLMRQVFENREEAKFKGERARKHILENYNWQRTAEIIEGRIREIARERRFVATHPPTAKPVFSHTATHHAPRIIWEGTQFVHHSLAI